MKSVLRRKRDRFEFCLYLSFIKKIVEFEICSWLAVRTLLQCRPIPMRKLSGLMSLWMKLLQWTYSIRPIIWSASIRTVLMVKRREQKLKRSSNDGPSRSMTRTLNSLSWPYHLKKKKRNRIRNKLWKRNWKRVDFEKKFWHE